MIIHPSEEGRGGDLHIVALVEDLYPFHLVESRIMACIDLVASVHIASAKKLCESRAEELRLVRTVAFGVSGSGFARPERSSFV